jgi:hypothetical protein
MKSTCTTKERRRLVQVKHKWCDELNKDNFKHKLYMAHNLWKKAPPPSLIIYFMTLHKGYIQMVIFPNTSEWESQNWDFYCFEFWTVRSSSNQAFMEHAKAIYYNLQKHLSSNVLHVPIKDHLTPFLKGFVVGSYWPFFWS